VLAELRSQAVSPETAAFVVPQYVASNPEKPEALTAVLRDSLNPYPGNQEDFGEEIRCIGHLVGASGQIAENRLMMLVKELVEFCERVVHGCISGVEHCKA
jgi:hypothetical protein